MKHMTSFAGGLALAVLFGGLTVSQPAQAWENVNKLYRCVMQARTTLCNEVWTRMQGATARDEVCHSWSMSARSDRLWGGGLLFSPPPDNVRTTNNILNCAASSITGNYNTEVGLKGFISPCAPGGPDGWAQFADSSVDWFDGWGYADVDYRYTTTHYPLATSTCDGGGGPLQ